MPTAASMATRPCVNSAWRGGAGGGGPRGRGGGRGQSGRSVAVSPRPRLPEGVAQGITWRRFATSERERTPKKRRGGLTRTATRRGRSGGGQRGKRKRGGAANEVCTRPPRARHPGARADTILASRARGTAAIFRKSRPRLVWLPSAACFVA